MDARMEKMMTNMKSWIPSHIHELESVDDLSIESLAAVKRAIEKAQVERYVKTLTPITVFSREVHYIGQFFQASRILVINQSKFHLSVSILSMKPLI